MINYNNKRFKVVDSSKSEDLTSDMTFHYQQTGDIVTSTYDGGLVKKGHIIGIVMSDGSLHMRCHHIKWNGEIIIGICQAIPEFMENGKLRLHGKWKWISWNLSEGNCVLEEL